MKLEKLFLSAAAALLCMTSCGGNSESATTTDTQTTEEKVEASFELTPQTTSINGAIGKAFKVVEKEYVAKGDFPKLNVEIELADPTKLPADFDAQTVGTPSNKGDKKYAMLATFEVEYLDADGNVIETKGNGDGIGRLLRLTEGDRATLTFYLPFNADPNELKQFRIISDYYPNTPEEVAEAVEMSADEAENASGAAQENKDATQPANWNPQGTYSFEDAVGRKFTLTLKKGGSAELFNHQYDGNPEYKPAKGSWSKSSKGYVALNFFGGPFVAIGQHEYISDPILTSKYLYYDLDAYKSDGACVEISKVN